VADQQALVEAVAAEMSHGITSAVDFWMTQIEDALGDPHLTTLDRLNAVQEILKHYRNDSGPEPYHGYAA
jgi:hypothetical protein